MIYFSRTIMGNSCTLVLCDRRRRKWRLTTHRTFLEPFPVSMPHAIPHNRKRALIVYRLRACDNKRPPSAAYKYNVAVFYAHVYTHGARYAGIIQWHFRCLCSSFLASSAFLQLSVVLGVRSSRCPLQFSSRKQLCRTTYGKQEKR